ncbi:MAG: hypothetical protein HY707_07630 [Ignavibacteriae bacterium]|nr:hypothetical protein [Ignavibacteriota bacterium]
MRIRESMESKIQLGVVRVLVCLIIVIATAELAKAQGLPYDTVVVKEIEQFIHERMKFFEMIDKTDSATLLDQRALGFTRDIQAIFYIPTQKKELIYFDFESFRRGFGGAYAYYKGKQARMQARNIVVLPRSGTEAVASFVMDFYLQGTWRNDALTIVDLRKEDGSWKVYRWYENKRK